jgi:hypothetical protein
MEVSSQNYDISLVVQSKEAMQGEAMSIVV